MHSFLHDDDDDDDDDDDVDDDMHFLARARAAVLDLQHSIFQPSELIELSRSKVKERLQVSSRTA